MLENIDLSLSVKNNKYKDSMKILEVKLGELQRKAWELKIPIIFVFEGWHASGLGEDINRLILSLYPRGYDHWNATKMHSNLSSCTFGPLLRLEEKLRFLIEAGTAGQL